MPVFGSVTVVYKSVGLSVLTTGNQRQVVYNDGPSGFCLSLQKIKPSEASEEIGDPPK